MLRGRANRRSASVGYCGLDAAGTLTLRKVPGDVATCILAAWRTEHTGSNNSLRKGFGMRIRMCLLVLVPWLGVALNSAGADGDERLSSALRK